MNFHFTRFRRPPAEIYGREYKHAPILRILSLFMLMILILVAGSTAFFVYYRLINTIGHVQSIIVLRSVLCMDPVNFERLEKVQAAWETKHATTTLLIVRDPFQAAPAAAASSTKPVNNEP